MLQPGQKVTLSGIYSAAEEGIAPDPDWTTYSYCIKPGEPADLEKEIRSKRFQAKLWMTLAAIAVAVYYLVIMPIF